MVFMVNFIPLVGSQAFQHLVQSHGHKQWYYLAFDVCLNGKVAVPLPFFNHHLCCCRLLRCYGDLGVDGPRQCLIPTLPVLFANTKLCRKASIGTHYIWWKWHMNAILWQAHTFLYSELRMWCGCTLCSECVLLFLTTLVQVCWAE